MRILLVTGRYPWPPLRGDQMRVHQHLELLGEEHRVTLLTSAPPASAPPPPETVVAEILTLPPSRPAVVSGLLRALLTGLPLQAGLYLQPGMRRRLRRLAAEVDLVVFHLVRLVGYAGELGSTPYAVDLVDSLSLSFRRRSQVDRPWRRGLLRYEAGRLAAAERRLILGAGRSYVVCERDRQHLLRGLPEAVQSRLQVLPLLVESREPSGAAAASARATLALTGNLGYFVNRDALDWWLEGVWPRLRSRRPKLDLVVAGARPEPGLERRLRRVGGRLIAAPESLLPVLEQATVALAPMRCGAGVPVKVLEAWAAGTPVVASPWAAAGTTGREGQELLVADRPDDWVKEIERLLDDPPLRTRLAAAGRRRLHEEHSRGRVGAVLRRLVKEAAAAKRF